MTRKKKGDGAWRLMIYTKKTGEQVVLEIDVHNLFINLFIILQICVLFLGRLVEIVPDPYFFSRSEWHF